MNSGGLPAEAQARQRIDSDLNLAGWIIQDRAEMNLSAGPGVAVREVPMGDGRVDYLLYLNKNDKSTCRDITAVVVCNRD